MSLRSLHGGRAAHQIKPERDTLIGNMSSTKGMASSVGRMARSLGRAFIKGDDGASSPATVEHQLVQLTPRSFESAFCVICLRGAVM
jgi:hypothetical protein